MSHLRRRSGQQFLSVARNNLKIRHTSGPGIRLDDGIYEGWTVPNEYDPMLGKLIAWGANRPEAIARMQRALGEYFAGGIKTNLSLFQRILSSRDFETGAIFTQWLDEFLKKPAEATQPPGGTEANVNRAEDAVAIAVALWHQRSSQKDRSAPAQQMAQNDSQWKKQGRLEQLSRKVRP